MNNGLTINQEKRMRADKLNNPIAKLADLESFAKVVQQYRRAQRINTEGSSELRKELIQEIDTRLKALGL